MGVYPADLQGVGVHTHFKTRLIQLKRAALTRTSSKAETQRNHPHQTTLKALEREGLLLLYLLSG